MNKEKKIDKLFCVFIIVAAPAVIFAFVIYSLSIIKAEDEPSRGGIVHLITHPVGGFVLSGAVIVFGIFLTVRYLMRHR